MRKVFHLFKDAIKQCNVFTAPVNLRYDLDPDYNTLTGAFVSIGLIVLLVSVFYSQWLALLNRQAISSSSEMIQNFDPVYMNMTTDDFMFAIGITGLNLSDATSFFSLKMKFVNVTNSPTYKKTSTYLTLQQCTSQHWQQLGDEFVHTFTREGISAFLCPPRNMTVQLQGKYTSQNFLYYKLTVDPCTKNCRNQSQLAAWIAANTTFSFNFYYANTLINPDQVVPISTFFEDKDYTMFSTSLFTETNLYIGDYDMETDNSIFPWTDVQEDTGFIVNRNQKQSWNFMAANGMSYCTLFLRKSDMSLQVSRSFRKIDDMLSYIGGLFGIITAALGFVMNYYHRCSFELELSQNFFDYHNKKCKKQKINQKLSDNSQFDQSQSSPFSPDNLKAQDTQEEKQESKPQKIIEPGQFGFLDFLMHLLYLPINKIFGCQWRRMNIYQESLEEIRHKLDVSKILEKLAFYDRSFNVIFDQNQLKLLYLQEKFNFEEVRRQREMLGMKHDIIANIFGMMTSEQKQVQQPQQVHKKSLNEIAEQRSSRRLNTFRGQPINIFDMIPQLGTKQTSETEAQANLPDDIKYALKKLDEKIQKGDPISIRIYNNLQYQILEAFEKSKMKRSKQRVAIKKPPPRRIKMEKKEKKGDTVMVVNFANMESANQMSNHELN